MPCHPSVYGPAHILHVSLQAASTKMEESYAKLTDNEAQAAHGRLEVISYTTLAEINHFNQYRVGDFKLIMQRYLQAQINFHENVSLLVHRHHVHYVVLLDVMERSFLNDCSKMYRILDNISIYKLL